MRSALTMLTATLLLLPTAGARAQFKVTCESYGHDHHYCPVDTSGGVELDHQLSHAGCWRGDTWGYDSKGIWVSNGCSAEFTVGSEARDLDSSTKQPTQQKKGGDKAGAIIGGLLAAGVVAAIVANQDDSHDSAQSQGYSQGQNGRLVTCQSHNGQYQYCNVGWAQHVELHRQLSGNPCNYNRTWGYDRNGIWVSNNCRAEFMIDGHDNSWGWEDNNRRGVTLYRDVDYRGRSELISKNVSSLQGSSIGNDQASSARVSPGCRARLYQHEDFQGSYIEISGGVRDLRGSRIGNDTVTSVQLRCN